jgi:hypothetical protein
LSPPEKAGLVFLVVSGVMSALTAGFMLASRLASEGARARRRLSRFPRVRLSDGRSGSARLTGRVVAVGNSLRAPLSGRPCVYWEVTLRVVSQRVYLLQQRGASAGSGAAVTIKPRGGKAFEIDDDTGRARVVIPGPKVPVGRFGLNVCTSVPVDHPLSGAYPAIPPELVSLAVAAGAVSEPSQFVEGDEGIIAAGDVITVGGELSYEVHSDVPAAHFRTPPERATVTGGPLILIKER